MTDGMVESAGALLEQYLRNIHSRAGFLVCVAAILAVVVIADLCCGASSLGVLGVFKALIGGTGIGHDIVWELRLPRVVMAVVAGAGLGLAGVVFQAVLRNPLASPFTLGIGSGAGFGAVVAVIVFGQGGQPSGIAFGAFTCALLSAFIVVAVSRFKRATPETMILAGIALMFLFSSLGSLLQYTGTMEQVHEIVFWFFGSLSKVGWSEIRASAFMVFLAFPLLLAKAWDFNLLLMMGDESASALGINVERLRVAAVVLASLATAGSICFTGLIGFVGLVSPHVARIIIGCDHRFLMPASALLGALTLVVADIAGRSFWKPHAVPIGIVTSFVGVPFFFYLLLKRSREYW